MVDDLLVNVSGYFGAKDVATWMTLAACRGGRSEG